MGEYSRQYIVLIAIILFALNAMGQLVFEQNIVQGGITAAGFSTGQGSGSGNFDIYIEPGSTIKKAYVFSYTQRYPPTAEFTLNDLSFTFDTTNIIMDVDYSSPPSSFASPSRLYYKDITDEIDSETNSFTATIPFQPNLPINAGFWTLFLIVVYEHPELNNMAYSILINDQNLTGNESYQINNLNPINSTVPVGLSLYTDRHGLPNISGTNVYVNDNHLGLIYGSDTNSLNWNFSGVKGHFYYQSSALMGLDDDNENLSMNGSDALADISCYIDHLDVELEFDLIHTNYPNPSPGAININLAYTLAYTTPCLPFETTLTEEVETCRGDTAQLLATGGINYDWLPEEGLSCYNCPNPVFGGDSSKIYTVRIWNTDSCSKVLPVKVNVLDAPHTANLSTSPATCGEANGVLSINGVSGGQPQYFYNIGGNWITNPTAPLFSALEAGNYTFTVRDQNHCYYSQDFTIEEVNLAQAAFSANPQSGTEPLEVQFYNQSSGTNQYEWTLQDSVSNDFNFNFTFDSAGTYQVQLISWYNETHCADTAMATIIVHPTPPDYSHSIFMPTLYNLEIGDLFIETTNVQRVEFEIYNAKGQRIFSTTLDAADGRNEIWNGSRHARGYYFFRIKYWDMQGLEFSERGKVLVVR